MEIEIIEIKFIFIYVSSMKKVESDDFQAMLYTVVEHG
jgi:hypothetical protein